MKKYYLVSAVLVVALAVAAYYAYSRQMPAGSATIQALNSKSMTWPKFEDLSAPEQKAVQIATPALYERYPQGKAAGGEYRVYEVAQPDPQNPNVFQVIFDIENVTDMTALITVDIQTAKVLKFVKVEA